MCFFFFTPTYFELDVMGQSLMSPFMVLALGLLFVNIITVIAVKLKVVLTYHFFFLPVLM